MFINIFFVFLKTFKKNIFLVAKLLISLCLINSHFIVLREEDARKWDNTRSTHFKLTGCVCSQTFVFVLCVRNIYKHNVLFFLPHTYDIECVSKLMLGHRHVNFILCLVCMSTCMCKKKKNPSWWRIQINANQRFWQKLPWPELIVDLSADIQY